MNTPSSDTLHAIPRREERSKGSGTDLKEQLLVKRYFPIFQELTNRAQTIAETLEALTPFEQEVLNFIRDLDTEIINLVDKISSFEEILLQAQTLRDRTYRVIPIDSDARKALLQQTTVGFDVERKLGVYQSALSDLRHLREDTIINLDWVFKKTDELSKAQQN